MSSENQLLGHIYQTAEMGREGIRSVLKYAREPKLVDALNSQYDEYGGPGPAPPSPCSRPGGRPPAAWVPWPRRPPR